MKTNRYFIKSASLKELFILYVFVFVSWSFYRYFLKLPEIIDETVIKPLVWIGPIVILLLWKKIKFSSLGFQKLNIRIFLISFFSGIGLALMQLIPNYLKTGFQIDLSNLSQASLIVLGTAISEEILFRGYILQKLKLRFSFIPANIITSILFGIIHIPVLIFVNHTAGVDILFGLYILFVTSLIFGLLFNNAKTLWSPIVAHSINNLLLIVFIHPS